MPAAGRTPVRLNPVPVAVGVFAGCGAVQLLPGLFSPLWILAGLPFLLLLRRSPWARLTLAATLAMTAWTLHAANTRMAERLILPAGERSVDLDLRGWVDGIPEQTDGGWRFNLAVEHQRLKKLRLSWYDAGNPGASLQPGQCWDMTLRLKPPRGMANPGIFDYESWLLRKGISATGYVRDARPCPNADRGGLNHWRADLAGRLRESLAGSPASGLAAALLLGERSGITDQQWDVLRRTGTSHLMAISGLHIGLVATAVYWLIKLLIAFFPALTNRTPAQRWAAAMAIPAAISYALLSGFDLPAQRACIMVVVALLALLLGRFSRPMPVLAIALIAVLIRDPFAPLAAGFWLSFAAVGWILYLFAGRTTQHGKVFGWLWLQLALTAALAPLCLLWFQEASWTAPLANLILIPLMGLYLPLLLVIGLPLLAFDIGSSAIWAPAIKPLELTWLGLSGLDGLAAGTWSVAMPGLWITAAAVAGLLLLFSPRGMPARLCGLLLLLPLAWPDRDAIPTGQAELLLLDVGQGLAGVIRTRHHSLLYDAGPRYRSGFDTGEAVVLPSLRAMGISRLDRILLSHEDIDHRGGLDAVRAGIRIGDELNTAGSPACYPGLQWQWDDVTFTVLHPYPDDNWNDNNGSCVLRVSAGEQHLLLPGDIERAAEQALLNRHPPGTLQADVLVAPHHGSASSSSTRFINTVQPQTVLFAAASGNRWGFPRPEIIRRYESAGAHWWQTGRDGAIRLRLGKGLNAPEISSWREQSPRYWRTR